ncbi:MAG: hypothetical protein P8Q90_02260 [Candidatus Thalassarchaeaceae archaeon]|nr:hypothetical protein [Candidatus Thalassarchaeaceae archaeon]
MSMRASLRFLIDISEMTFLLRVKPIRYRSTKVNQLSGLISSID